MRTLKRYAQTWPLNRPFVIARGASTSIDVIRVELHQEGHVGTGESKPTPRYGHSVESVLADIDEVSLEIEQGIDRKALLERLPAGPARNALDCALWSLECALEGTTPTARLGPPVGREIITAHTISIATPEEMAKAARQELAQGARLLKIKLNDEQVVERVRAVREAAPNVRIIIDANEAWAPQNVEDYCRELAALDVEMIEQPLPAGEDAVLAEFDHPLPLCADESCHTRKDVALLSDRYDMINIKLDKSGGLTEALAMADAAHEQGMAIMVGCMLGTSVAMRAALPVAARASIVDLDGPIWLSEDDVPALDYRDGWVRETHDS
ncbi:L-alanine-DL-glutamate epimerase-like enolase superfamily enzyme [Kushneria indalinina DSM 14324]|uniref:Dipeptide epimerase n=2 Tax=Kushneria indalinina TaxID=184067 RepID=A0A3D9DRX7_9GAMM|nr:L-alanine-DL-glutamate epimerase-like enolase superfamily enzyme [Kushneria indalinina DSM 14324]